MHLDWAQWWPLLKSCSTTSTFLTSQHVIWEEQGISFLCFSSLFYFVLLGLVASSLDSTLVCLHNLIIVRMCGTIAVSLYLWACPHCSFHGKIQWVVREGDCLAITGFVFIFATLPGSKISHQTTLSFEDPLISSHSYEVSLFIWDLFHHSFTCSETWGLLLGLEDAEAISSLWRAHFFLEFSITRILWISCLLSL